MSNLTTKFDHSPCIRRLARFIKNKVHVKGLLGLGLKRYFFNTIHTRYQPRRWLGANCSLVIARRRTHADDFRVSPALCAGATGVHDVVLKSVDGVLLFLEAAPVGGDWVEVLWVDDLEKSKDADLGVVFPIVWVG